MDKDELIQTTERLNEEIFDFINDVEDLFEKYEIKNEQVMTALHKKEKTQTDLINAVKANLSERRKLNE